MTIIFFVSENGEWKIFFLFVWHGICREWVIGSRLWVLGYGFSVIERQTTMKKYLYILLLVLTSSVWLAEAAGAATATEPFRPPFSRPGSKRNLDSLVMQANHTDTVYVAYLPAVYVYPQMKFKSKQQERFYWRTVRDVKKTLPYAKMIKADMEYADREMAKLTTKKEKKAWWKKYEKYLFKKYEDDFRNMYASQGRMLMLLLARESDTTSYELIRRYKNKATADFWQIVAKIFKNDLKEDYDGNDKDRIIERVITLVEAGQL